MTKISSGTNLGDILKAGKHALSGKFKKTVGKMRERGLEIIFVFDSTGSMGSVLQAAKDRMSKMAAVLLELVPYARIGVITYRDHGESEAYLTREVALSRDFYRAINFVKTVEAGGGANEPEAVYTALREAVREKGSKTAHRLVILIGDAPPHAKTVGKISNMVRNFARNGRSAVHAIVTKPSSATEITQVTEKSFKRIAKDGRGEALAFEDERGILKAVMGLTFGRGEKSSLEEVYRRAELRSKRCSNGSKSIVEKKDLKQLRRGFSKRVISHDLVKAILNHPNAVVLEELVGYTSKGSFPRAGRHAASYILQRLLHLAEPPVDPETCRAIGKRRADSYRKSIRRQFK